MTEAKQEAQPKLLEKSKTILIRHANSTFNYRWHAVEKEIEEGQATSEKFLEIIKDTVLLDCPLSDLGIIQCQEAQPLANSLIGIKTVLISPLRRALQTAYLVFKDHPNFQSIKFIVHPMLRENMHTVCDIPENFLDVKNAYEGKIP